MVVRFSWHRRRADDLRPCFNNDRTRECFTGDSITNGLVGQWSFDESEGCTASDASGNGYDGALMGCNEDGTIKNTPTTLLAKSLRLMMTVTRFHRRRELQQSRWRPGAVGSYPYVRRSLRHLRPAGQCSRVR